MNEEHRIAATIRLPIDKGDVDPVMLEELHCAGNSLQD